ncbi:hypothetical protein KKH27_07340 [bacterium]|nr:hypothetical protein [bacterium]MBU1984194.1 hypothetical protein [bacterium]
MRSVLIFALMLVFPVAGMAQLISNPNPPVPAALAVGGAFTAAATGAEAPHYNPAGLAYSQGTEGRLVHHQPWGLSFLSHLSASGFSQLPGRAGGLAAGIQTLGTREGGHTMSAETEIFLAHGLMLQEDLHTSLAFGYTVKLISWSLGESVGYENQPAIDLGSAATLGLDVGATAQLWDRFRLGGSFKNINHPQMGEGVKRDLPRVLSGGVSYFPYYGVRTTFDVERVVSGETQFKGGVNATVVKPLDLRFGINTNPNSFTAGFGLHFRELVIDYAFLYHPIFNPSHLIGIGFNIEQGLGDLWRGK